MQALNTALRAMLPHLLAWEREQLQAQLLIRILGFATDGLPTDPPGGFERGLAALTSHAPGWSSLRLAVAIGRDANSEPLDRFRSRDAPVLVAETIDVIVDRLVAASIAVSRMSEAGADRDVLARQLLQPEARPGSSVDDDRIL